MTAAPWIITPTAGRPEAFGLLRRWVAAQTLRPAGWLVALDGPRDGYDLDGCTVVAPPPGPLPSLNRNLLAALDALPEDAGAACILEDDDYYAPEYLRAYAAWLAWAPLVGEHSARYYHARTRRWRQMNNRQHASLAQTGLRREAFGALRLAAEGGSPFLDRDLWRLGAGPRRLGPPLGLHVSVKGLPGTPGLGIGHALDFGVPDPAGVRARAWGLPADYDVFHDPTALAAPPGAAPFAGALGGAAGGLIAPAETRDRPRAFAGRLARKPWEHRVTCAIPHLETPEPLEMVVRLLLAQDEAPYVLVIDTGSGPEAVAQLEALRADPACAGRVEVHYLRAHGWRHSSEPVAAAMDGATGLCRTEYLYATHADCFPIRRDWLRRLADRCGPGNPVLGYRMSDRSWLTDEWAWMVGRTATMIHRPTVVAAGVSWGMDRYGDLPAPGGGPAGWPDTETGFNRGLRAAGIAPEFLGDEPNYRRYTDAEIDHVRSYPSGRIYGAGRRDAEAAMADALAGARRRLAAWGAGDGGAGGGVKTGKPAAGPLGPRPEQGNPSTRRLMLDF